jgi:hypothetical protein
MDVALLRATIVDANGNPVLDATDNVTFAVKSGPGFIAGVGNGDPACQEPSQVRPISHRPAHRNSQTRPSATKCMI